MIGQAEKVLYPVNDCYTCVQGEGVQTGVAMVLLRLHGCDVGCPWCDTAQTWRFEAENERPTIKDALDEKGYKVALETSGTEAGHLGARIDWICVSPKIDMPGGKTIKLEALEV